MEWKIEILRAWVISHRKSSSREEEFSFKKKNPKCVNKIVTFVLNTHTWEREKKDDDDSKFSTNVYKTRYYECLKVKRRDLKAKYN